MPDETDEDTLAFDHEIAQRVGPTDPDNLFRLGQAFPQAETVVDALKELMPQEAPESLAASAREYDDAVSRPYQGSVVDPADIPALQAEQVPASPTGPKAVAYAGDPADLDRSNWHTLEELPPLRPQLRGPEGHEITIRIREVPLAAFLTETLRPLPPWVDRHIFADQSLQEHGPTVRYVIGYTQAGLGVTNRNPPDWVVQASLDLPSVHRNSGV